jgi:hypothetical protein
MLFEFLIFHNVLLRLTKREYILVITLLSLLQVSCEPRVTVTLPSTGSSMRRSSSHLLNKKVVTDITVPPSSQCDFTLVVQ